MSAVPHGLADWLSSNERRTWKPIAGEFLHFCPFVGELIDEHLDEITRCRCFTSREFLDAQDKRAVAMDLSRADAK